MKISSVQWSTGETQVQREVDKTAWQAKRHVALRQSDGQSPSDARNKRIREMRPGNIAKERPHVHDPDTTGAMHGCCIAR
jgi:hypothetical protein